MTGFKRLYLRLAVAMGLLFVVLAGALIWISTVTGERHALETTQRVNREIAVHAAEDMPLMEGGVVNQTAVKELAHHVMFINPIVEVYLLDTNGRILSHALPYGSVLRDRVDMQPLHRFMQGDTQLPLFADDPRSEVEQKTFSVSPIADSGGETVAYLYTVLNGKKHESVQQALSESENLRNGILTILAAVAAALLAGFVLFFLLTRRIHVLATAVRQYREGSYKGELNLRPASTQPDEIDELSLAIHDMSQRIDRQFDAQQEIDRSRRELIANVSHDLRTPVSSMQGFIETVLVKKLSAEEQRDYLETAHKHCIRLNKLIGELFELSTLESGATEPDWERFPVMELVQDIIHDHELSAQERGVTLSAEAATQNVEVYADIAMIHRVLDNLISNALKHTSSGDRISIRVANDVDRVRVEVIDNGEGISARDIPHIFERYYQPDTERQANGHGLGLAIVKRIVELHRSQIAVRSERNNGTEFRFWLPQPA